jgi:NADPH:quinone reductase-like Zn-dependent oxidoreductase
MAFTEFGGPEVLREMEMPDPTPGPDEVVIRVAAVSIGRLLDLAARSGKMPWAKIEPPHVLGADHVGEIVEVGSNVRDLTPGTRVAVYPSTTCGTCRWCREGRDEVCPNAQVIGVQRQGAYAELSVVPARNAHAIGPELTDHQAAALALNGPVAYNQFQRIGGIEPGTWVLVQAGASALGSMAVVLGVHLGLRVITTSRDAGKRQALADLGVEAALDWTTDGFVEQVQEMTGGDGVEVVIDNIGAEDMFAATMGALSRGGTVVTSGAFMAGRPTLDLRSLYTLSQRIVGVRTGSLEAVEGLWREVERGLKPVTDRTFSLWEAPAAHEHVQRDENIGRVALVP